MLLGHHRQDIGRRFGAEKRREVALVNDTAALLCGLAPMKVDHPPPGHRYQQTPQIVTVREAIELLSLGPEAQPAETAQGNVLFVRHSTVVPTHERPGHFDEALKISSPEFARSRPVTLLERSDPM
jgi:hypothetical protein